jgi:hypothetical protein
MIEHEDELDEGVSGSAWMFYHHYNPELLEPIQEIINGATVESVIDQLLEMDAKVD